MARFSDKVAVVTGASKGIGAGIAKRLASEGASVVVNYSSSKEDGEKVVAEIVGAGGKAIAIGANIGKEADVLRLFQEVKQSYGKVDILINNAGTFSTEPLDAFKPTDFHKHFDVNVLGLLLVTQAAEPLFPETGGAIVNLGSVVSTLAPPFGQSYIGTKAAVEAITLSLAKALAARKIRVNAVRPGLVITEGTRAAGMVGNEFEAAMMALTPLGRPGQPEDIAAAVAFLASEEASWITGEFLTVSGGGGM